MVHWIKYITRWTSQMLLRIYQIGQTTHKNKNKYQLTMPHIKLINNSCLKITGVWQLTTYTIDTFMIVKRIWFLKHLRQFVHSDWFLPVFISHDKDTAAVPRIDPFKRRVLFSYWKYQLRILNRFWSKLLLIFESV